MGFDFCCCEPGAPRPSALRAFSSGAPLRPSRPSTDSCLSGHSATFDVPPDSEDALLSLPPPKGLGREALRERIHQLQVLYRVGIALSAERDRDRLMETILIEAKSLCHADGGTLYIRDEQQLKFAIMRNDSLNLALGGTTGARIQQPPLTMRDPETGVPNVKNVATAAAVLRRSINIVDAYDAEGFDFQGTKQFDRYNNYRSQSFLTIPLVNQDDTVIGVLQLLNAVDPVTQEKTSFSAEQQAIVEALASQAAVALDNQLLLDGQKELLESFIKLIASAIDAKSPYTGGHCERVPILTLMLVRSLCEAESGPFAQFDLDAAGWYELQIAAWLHDCGKVTTPVHIMDKATKLETILDRIELVRARFGIVEREGEVELYKRLRDPGADESALSQEYERLKAALASDLEFLERANLGGESLSSVDQERIRAIGQRTYREGGRVRPLLTAEEIENLSVCRGTLIPAERIIINGHIVQTIKMLEALPFPKFLKRVPEYASGHHETMAGTGYPRGVFAGDLSIPARAMAIADVFEALTAQDRPYKSGKTLSQAMRIMGGMKRDNHLDPDLLDHFVSSGVYRTYAQRYLPDHLIDEVDEAALLAIEPKPFELPPEPVRAARRQGFLEEYRVQASHRAGLLRQTRPPRAPPGPGGQHPRPSTRPQSSAKGR